MGPGMFDGVGRALVMLGALLVGLGFALGACSTHFNCGGRFVRAAKEFAR